MNLENLQRISAASESACIAVLQKPEDAAARKRLFGALGDVVDPSFQGEEAAEYYSSQLIPEVRLWAEIVRTRIRLARDRTTLKATLRITYSIQPDIARLRKPVPELKSIVTHPPKLNAKPTKELAPGAL